MLTKSLNLVSAARKAFVLNAPTITAYNRQLIRRDHAHPPPDYKYATMDDIFVPCGSWQEHYDNQQRKYNIQLLLGTGFLIISIVVGIYSDALNFYLLPPARPAPKLP